MSAPERVVIGNAELWHGDCMDALPLLCHILNASTKPGAVVFDPFAGSGSLGEACHALGRKFIGIEKCPDNYAKAASRISAVHSQECIFTHHAKSDPRDAYEQTEQQALILEGGA